MATLAPRRGRQQGPGGRAGGRAGLPERASRGAPTDARRAAGARARAGPTISTGDPRRRRAAREARPARRAQRLVASSSRSTRPRRTGSRAATRPTVDLYLYDIREDLQRRVPAWEDVARRDGRRHARGGSRRAGSSSSYLVTAWTQRPEDEHRLLSSLLACVPRATRSSRPRTARSAAQRGGPARLPRRGPAADPGPVARRRLVGARRRAQAVARPRRHRADRRRPRSPYAGPPVLEESVDRRRRPRRRQRASAGQAASAAQRSASSSTRETELVPANAAAKDGGVRIRVQRRPSPASAPDVTGTAPVRARHRAARPADPSLGHLLGRLGARRGARAGRGRRAGAPTTPIPSDRFRGPVHLRRRRSTRCSPARAGPARADRLRRRTARRLTPAAARGARPTPPRPPAHDAPPAPPRRARSTSSALDVELLLVALAPDLDAALRAALRLPPRRRLAPARQRRPRARARRRGPRRPAPAGARAGSARRRRSSPAGSCSSRTPDRPFLTRVAARPRPGRRRTCSATTARSDRRRPCSSTSGPAASRRRRRARARARRGLAPRLPARARAGSAGRSLAAAALAALGAPPCCARPRAAGAPSDDPARVAARRVREARLRGARARRRARRGARRARRRRRAAPSPRPAGPSSCIGNRAWDPALVARACRCSSTRPCRRPTSAHALWRASLDGHATGRARRRRSTRSQFRLAPGADRAGARTAARRRPRSPRAAR